MLCFEESKHYWHITPVVNAVILTLPSPQITCLYKRNLVWENDICCNLSFLITFQLNWAPRHQLRHYDKILSLLGCLVDICQSHNKFDALQFKKDIYRVLKLHFYCTPTEVVCGCYLFVRDVYTKHESNKDTSIWLPLCLKNFRNIEVIILRAKPCQDSPKQFDKIFSKCRGMTNWLALDLLWCHVPQIRDLQLMMKFPLAF